MIPFLSYFLSVEEFFVLCVLLSWFCLTETDTQKKAVVNKPETKEAPAPKRDRIIGGIGGGGFMGGKEKGEVCFFENNSFLKKNFTDSAGKKNRQISNHPTAFK